MSKAPYNLRARSSCKPSEKSSNITRGISSRKSNKMTDTPISSPSHQPVLNPAPGNRDHVTPLPATAADASILTEMRSMFKDLTVQMNSKFDLVIADITAIKRELNITKNAVIDLEKSVDFNDSKIKNLEKEVLPKIHEQLTKKSEEIEDKLILLELHQRKQNLLIYGVPERKNENVYDTVKAVMTHFISREFAHKVSIVNTHRLPGPQAGNQRDRDRPRAIIVRFVNMADRDNLLQAFEQPRRNPTASSPTTGHQASGTSDTIRAEPRQPTQLPGQQGEPQPTYSRVAATDVQTFKRVTIRSDLPISMKRERGRLAELAYKLRQKQFATRIRISGTKVYLQTRKHLQNGAPPTSWSNWKE